MGSSEIITSIKTIGAICVWSLLKGNQVNLQERCRHMDANCGTIHQRRAAVSPGVYLPTYGSGNAVYIHKRLVFFYKEYGIVSFAGKWAH